MFTKADIEKYFNAEKSESLVFIILGAAAIVLALVFFFYLKTNWHKGFAIPLLIIGLLQLAGSYTVYKKCDEGRKRNVYAYDLNPDELKNKEIPRMEKVNKNFVALLSAEIILVLAGAGLFFYCKNDTLKTFWAGLGAALLIEAAITLGADVVAAKRATNYTVGLKSFISKIGGR